MALTVACLNPRPTSIDLSRASSCEAGSGGQAAPGGVPGCLGAGDSPVTSVWLGGAPGGYFCSSSSFFPFFPTFFPRFLCAILFALFFFGEVVSRQKRSDPQLSPVTVQVLEVYKLQIAGGRPPPPPPRISVGGFLGCGSCKNDVPDFLSHGCCWETCCIFADCGLVVNPHLPANFKLLLPFQREPRSESLASWQDLKQKLQALVAESEDRV